VRGGGEIFFCEPTSFEGGSKEDERELVGILGVETEGRTSSVVVGASPRTTSDGRDDST
jgi:hypothetical protein